MNSLSPSGTLRFVGPLTKVTSAPKSTAAWASEYPIFPLDLFERYLMGSISSLVLPLVIRSFLPFRASLKLSILEAILYLSIISTISSGSFILPLAS